jgi:hypothetical protein
MGVLESGLETSPPDTDGGIDTYEDEEWATKEFIKDLFCVYIGCDPAFPPLLSNKIKQVICGVEDVCFGRGVIFAVYVWDYARHFHVRIFLFDY